MTEYSFYYKAVARGEASGVRHLIQNLCLTFHVRPLGYCIHPILYLKTVPPLWFCLPPLRNPGDGLDSATALDTEMQRQDKAYVASCL